jgi:hypothetical protein
MARITKKINKAHAPAKTKASKYAPLVAPAYGKFKEERDYLFNETTLRKSKQGKLDEKERPKNEPNIVVLTADRACLFTAVNMDSKLRVQLLKAHCLLELRSAWYHPLSSAYDPLMHWLYTWNMWSMVKGFAECMLGVIMEEIFEGEEEKLKEEKEKTLADFSDYRKEVNDKSFHSIWVVPFGKEVEEAKKVVELETLHKQAKWYGYPYFIHVEQKDPKKFQAYLAFFPLWLNISVRLSEESMFGPESMYPAQGLQPPRVMTGWEVRHCPWYLDTKRWDNPFDNTEKQNGRTNNQGLPPPVIVSAAKEGEEDKAEEPAKKVNAALSKH